MIISIYVYIHIRIYVYTYTYLSISLSLYIYIYIYVYMHAYGGGWGGFDLLLLPLGCAVRSSCTGAQKCAPQVSAQECVPCAARVKSVHEFSTPSNNTIQYNTTQYYAILRYTILYHTILYYTTPSRCMDTPGNTTFRHRLIGYYTWLNGYLALQGDTLGTRWAKYA